MRMVNLIDLIDQQIFIRERSNAWWNSAMFSSLFTSTLENGSVSSTNANSSPIKLAFSCITWASILFASCEKAFFLHHVSKHSFCIMWESILCASCEKAFFLHHVSMHSSHPCYLLPCGPVPRPLKLVIQEEEKEGFCFTEFPTP